MKDKILNFIMMVLVILLIAIAVFKTTSTEFQNQVYRGINSIEVQYLGMQIYNGDVKQDFDSRNEKQNLEPYLKELQKNIQVNWKPRFGLFSKRVVLSLKIAKDGQLVGLVILSPLDNAEALTIALDAVTKTEPFMPLPNKFKGKSLNVELAFDYSVFNNISYKF